MARSCGIMFANTNTIADSVPLDTGTATTMIQGILDRESFNAEPLIEAILCRCNDTTYADVNRKGARLIYGNDLPKC